MQLLDEVNSVQLWHYEISNHKIERHHLKYLKCYGSIACFDDVMTRFA